ncbi:GntR family transcriptional regulator [Streptomyces sp. A7024]|uniref:GntR family transcriptional regulator n=1 Tax=Streptomyces coryli TaxID=1128680 RepID=A0A6G4UE06_9ACTN|nr:GntR family transcriptional regulator [Streptomyces coryli]NGN70403.1 GntR family transcriptional regulator [Streptomyces coryli]
MSEPGAGGAIVRRDTLRSQLAEALRDEILAGRLEAGRHVTVKELAATYGVSATPVREALVDLSAQGLLDAEEHRGYQVHAFTAADFRTMVEARAVVTEGIFRSAAESSIDLLPADRAALATMRRRAEEAERAARAGDLDVLVHYDLRFWREISDLAGNPYLTEFLDRMRIQCWVFAVPYLRRELRRTADAGAALPNPFWHGHRELVDAVEARDMAGAEAIIHAYNKHTLALIDQLTAE